MGLNFSELIVILVIVLILFGPGKLPDIGRALGRGIREFKKAQKDALDGDDSTTTPDIKKDTSSGTDDRPGSSETKI